MAVVKVGSEGPKRFCLSPPNFRGNGSVEAGSSFEGIRTCLLDIVKLRCFTEEVSRGRLAVQVWSLAGGAGLCWRPLRDEASGQSLEIRLGGGVLRMCLSCVVLEVRDWKAGRRGWTSFVPSRKKRGKEFWLVSAGEGCRV